MSQKASTNLTVKQISIIQTNETAWYLEVCNYNVTHIQSKTVAATGRLTLPDFKHMDDGQKCMRPCLRIFRLLEAPCCNLVAGNISSSIIPGFFTAPKFMSTTVREDLQLCALPDFSARFNDCFCTVLQYLKAIGDCHHFYYTLDIYHGRPLATHVFDMFPDFNRGKAGRFCCTSYWCDYKVSRVYDTHWNRFEITDPFGTNPLFGAAPRVTNDTVLHQSKVVLWGRKLRAWFGDTVGSNKVVQLLQLVQTLFLQDKQWMELCSYSVNSGTLGGLLDAPLLLARSCKWGTKSTFRHTSPGSCSGVVADSLNS